MPYGGNDWLALTQEPILEPELPICDPHHHFWDFRTGRIPYQRYLLHELTADTGSGHNIRSTVFIEARAMYRADGPAEMKPVGEVEFVQGLAAASASGLYGPCRAAAAIVGHADLKLGGRAEPVLETICCFPQLPEMVAFARAVPEVTIIINHLGGLNRTGPFAGKDAEVMAAWRAGMAELAKCPNVFLKLGGHGMPRFGFDWHLRDTPVGSEEMAAQIAPLMSYCIDQFGPERCMFESNFPVDKVSFSYPVLFNAFKRFSKGYTASERTALFHDTAVHAYRIAV